MADTNGSCNTGKYTTSSHGTIGLNLSWTLKSQSIENNTSTISWTLKSNGTMASNYSVKAGPVTCTINGTKVVNLTSRFDMKGSGNWKKTGTATITHGSDGKKTFNVSVTAALYSASVNVWTGTSSNHNISYTLPQIHRQAIITSGSAFTNNLSQSAYYPSFTYSNPAGTSLVTGLRGRLTWNSRANYTNWVTLNDEGGTYVFTSSTFTSANLTSMLNSCPNSMSLLFEYEIASTYDGVESSYYYTSAMYVADSEPIPGTISYLDINSDVVTNKTGDSSIIVQSQSTLRIRTTAATAQNGASIDDYKLEINGQSYTPIWNGNYGNVDFFQPSLSGTFVATFHVTDSRGFKSSATANVVIQPWEPPTALFTLSRVNGFYTNTILYVDGSISSVSGTNTFTIQERHRQSGASTWSAAATVPNKTNTTIALDKDYAWEMEILVTDEYATTTYNAAVGKGIPVMFIDANKNSVGVNGYPDANNQIYVDGTIKSTGKITCPSISYTDISSQYSATKSSGAWSLAISESIIYRSGNIIQVELFFSGNGSAVSGPTNSFVGTLSDGPLPLMQTTLCGYYNAIAINGILDSDGSLSVRPLGSVTLSGSNRFRLRGTFICA